MLQANLEAIYATAREIAAGMAYLHADNVLHGDLTAGNILLTASTKDSRQFTSKVRLVHAGVVRPWCEQAVLI